MRTMLCKLCRLAVLGWPFDCRNRLAWPIYESLLPLAGEEMERRGEI